MAMPLSMVYKMRQSLNIDFLFSFFICLSFSFLLSSSNLATKVVMTDEVEHDADCSVELSFLKRIGRLFSMRYKHNYNHLSGFFGLIEIGHCFGPSCVERLAVSALASYSMNVVTSS